MCSWLVLDHICRRFQLQATRIDNAYVNGYVKKLLKDNWNVTDFSRDDGTDTKDNTLAPILYAVDSLYLSAMMMGRMINESSDPNAPLLPDGIRFRQMASGIRFQGVSGPVILDADSERQPSFGLFTTSVNGTLYKLVSIDSMLLADESVTAVSYRSPIYLSAEQSVIADRDDFWLGGVLPVDEPVCGFTGVKCDYDPYIYGSVALVVVVLMLVALFFFKRYQWVSRSN